VPVIRRYWSPSHRIVMQLAAWRSERSCWHSDVRRRRTGHCRSIGQLRRCEVGVRL